LGARLPWTISFAINLIAKSEDAVNNKEQENGPHKKTGAGLIGRRPIFHTLIVTER